MNSFLSYLFPELDFLDFLVIRRLEFHGSSFYLENMCGYKKLSVIAQIVSVLLKYHRAQTNKYPATL